MPLHSQPLFETITDIPDLVPPELLLPPDRTKVHIVKAAAHTALTTSPVEVGYGFYRLGVGGFAAEYALLKHYQEAGGVPDDFLENNWGNHCGRIMLKAMLDPDRHAPIDLAEAYRTESRFRGYSADEEEFFSGFVENWGVLKRE